MYKKRPVHNRHWIRIVGPLFKSSRRSEPLEWFYCSKRLVKAGQHPELLALAEADADYIRDAIDAKNHEGTDGISARSNTDFMRDAHSFQAEFLADHPSQFLGVVVQFQRLAGLRMPAMKP